jgi:hypothetical protein
MTNRDTACLRGAARGASPVLAVWLDTITQLADAYQKFFASNGKSSNAKEAVRVASNELNSICPGAAS